MLPACRSAWRGGFDGRRLRFRDRSIPRANETEQAAPTPHGMPPASRTEKRMTLDLTLPRYVRPLLGCAAENQSPDFVTQSKPGWNVAGRRCDPVAERGAERLRESDRDPIKSLRLRCRDGVHVNRSEIPSPSEQ